MSGPKKRILFLAGIAALGLWAGDVSADDGGVAQVDGVAIPVSELNEAIWALPAPAQAEILNPENRRKFVENYVTWWLLVQEARKRKLEESPEYVKLVERAKNEILISLLQAKLQDDMPVTDKDVRAYYESRKADFQTPETRRARHILVLDEKKAGEILKRLKAGGKFEAEARLHSEDKASAAEGGDIGWHERGEIIPEFAKTIFSMKSGELLDKPLRTRRGWHLIRLEGIRPAKEPDYKQIQDEVRQRYIQERRGSIIPDLAKRLKEKSNVQINDEALKSLGTTSKPAK